MQFGFLISFEATDSKISSVCKGRGGRWVSGCLPASPWDQPTMQVRWLYPERSAVQSVRIAVPREVGCPVSSDSYTQRSRLASLDGCTQRGQLASSDGCTQRGRLASSDGCTQRGRLAISDGCTQRGLLAGSGCTSVLQYNTV